MATPVSASHEEFMKARLSCALHAGSIGQDTRQTKPRNELVTLMND